MSDRVLTLDEAIAAHVRNVLALAGGNASKAARLLGIHRSRIRRLIKRATQSAPAVAA